MYVLLRTADSTLSKAHSVAAVFLAPSLSVYSHFFIIFNFFIFIYIYVFFRRCGVERTDTHMGESGEKRDSWVMGVMGLTAIFL